MVLLDASCVMQPPENLGDLAESAAVSTLTIAELAFGLHVADPFEAARRERRYRRTLEAFDPVPYSAGAAHWYGAIAATVRRSGRDPRPRRIDLMLASVAVDLSAALLTRNAADFAGLESLVNVVAVT